MPSLPKYGWLFHCEMCEIITSRITKVSHRRRTCTYSVCISCRTNFIREMTNEYGPVYIQSETVGEQRIKIPK